MDVHFSKNPALVQSRWAVPSYPHRHVWYFQLAVALLQHFFVEKLPALLQRMETKGSEILFLPQSHYLVWWLCWQGRRIFHLSVSSHIPERKGAAPWHVPWVLCSWVKLCDKTDQTDFLDFSLFKDPMMLEPGCWSAVSTGCWEFPWKIWKSWRNLCLRAWRSKKRRSQSKNIWIDMGSKNAASAQKLSSNYLCLSPVSDCSQPGCCCNHLWLY